MELYCPTCNSPILIENINVASDLAKCDYCKTIHKASELVDKKLIDRIKYPPAGAKFIVTKNYHDSIELFYPKKGLTLVMIPQILFSIFWLAFITFWTWGAAHGSVIFALFSIPFWLVGFGMIIGVINSIFETQTLKMNNLTITLIKDRPLKPKKFEVKINEVESIRMKNFKSNPYNSMMYYKMMMKSQRSFGMGGFEMPAIISGFETVYFFEDANDAEQEWVTQILDNMLKKLKR